MGQMKENTAKKKSASNNKKNKKNNRNNKNNKNNKNNPPSNNKVFAPLPDKKEKKVIKYEYKKLAAGYIEGKAGPTKRKTTTRNLGNAHILDFLKESDKVEERKRQEEEEEKSW